MLKQLLPFMGCIRHLIKFFLNRAEISEPLRPLLSKANTKPKKLRLEGNTYRSIKSNKSRIKKITENKHFDTSKKTRVQCDASKKAQELA